MFFTSRAETHEHTDSDSGPRQFAHFRFSKWSVLILVFLNPAQKQYGRFFFPKNPYQLAKRLECGLFRALELDVIYCDNYHVVETWLLWGSFSAPPLYELKTEEGSTRSPPPSFTHIAVVSVRLGPRCFFLAPLCRRPSESWDQVLKPPENTFTLSTFTLGVCPAFSYLFPLN